MHQRKICRAITVGVLLGGAGTALAGDLNPPVGSITSTMKPLDAIEPRVCLTDVAGSPAAVHRIVLPGQYLLTGHVVVSAGKHGILIDLPPGTPGTVSIDLNGFEIQGQPGSLDGVRRSGETSLGDFVITKGLIRDMGGDGVHVEDLQECRVAVSVRDCNGDGLEAVRCPLVTCGVAINQKGTGAEKNRIAGCGGNGVVTTDCDDVDVSSLSVSQCAGNGLSVSGSARVAISSVTVQECAATGVALSNCQFASLIDSALNLTDDGITVFSTGTFESSGVTIEGFAGDGAVFTTTKDVKIKGHYDVKKVEGILRGGGVPGGGRGLVFDTCSRVSVQGCAVADIDGDGIQVIECDRASLTGCRVDDCDGDGISASAASSSSSRWLEVDLRSPAGSGAFQCGGHGLHIVGIDTVLLSGGSVRDCGGDGVHIEQAAGASDKFAQVRGFQVERCAGDGFEIECDDLSMADCTALNNGGHGAYGKSIRKNISVTLFKSHRNQLDGLHVSDGAARTLRQQGKSTQVTRSNISNNRGGGVTVIGSGPLTMEEVECDGNDKEGCFALLLPALGSVQEKAKQVKCRFNNNGFGTPTAYPGVMIQGAASFEMREVECSGNAGSGLVAADFNRDGRLDFVTCSSNGGNGVQVSSSSGTPNGRLRVSGTLCVDNGSNGMFLEATTGGEVSECTFSGNAGFGLFMIGSGHVVRTNTCSSNAGGSLFVPVPGNVVGPLIDELSVAGNCNPAANYVH